jgi:hypothetical protein
MIGDTVASDPLLSGDIDVSHVTPKLCEFGLPTTLVTRLQSVESLKVTGRLYIPQALCSILFLASQSTRLTSLSFSSAIDISENKLISLFTSTNGSLEHVDLSFCHHIGSLPIITLIDNHPNLLTLNLSRTSLTDNALLSLHHLHHLTDLSLEGCFNLTRASMSKFLQTNLPPRLSRLNLSYLFTVLGEWLAQLNSNVKFERLDVRYAEHVTKRDIRGLRERWGNGCEVLTTARLETDDEPGWKQYVDEIVKAEVVY